MLLFRAPSAGDLRETERGRERPKDSNGGLARGGWESPVKGIVLFYFHFTKV